MGGYAIYSNSTAFFERKGRKRRSSLVKDNTLCVKGARQEKKEKKKPTPARDIANRPAMYIKRCLGNSQ
jgi:hypothetical protein